MDNQDQSRYFDLCFENLELKHSNERLKEKLAQAEADINSRSVHSIKQSKEIDRLEDCCKKRKRFSFFFAGCAVFFLSLFVLFAYATSVWTARYNQLSEDLHNHPILSDIPRDDYEEISDIYNARYAAGYQDAISGVYPDIASVQCFSCGETDPSGSGFVLHLHNVSGIWVPLCTSCMSSSTKQNPITIMEENYYFRDAPNRTYPNGFVYYTTDISYHNGTCGSVEGYTKATEEEAVSKLKRPCYLCFGVNYAPECDPTCTPYFPKPSETSSKYTSNFMREMEASGVLDAIREFREKLESSSP